MDAPPRLAKGEAPALCTHPGCERPYKSRGYCSLHYQRLRLGRDMDAPVRIDTSRPWWI